MLSSFFRTPAFRLDYVPAICLNPLTRFLALRVQFMFRLSSFIPLLGVLCVTHSPTSPYPGSCVLLGLPRLTRSPMLPYPGSRVLFRSPACYPVSDTHLTRALAFYSVSRVLPGLSHPPYPGSRMLPGLPRLKHAPACYPVSRAFNRLPRATRSPAP